MIPLLMDIVAPFEAHSGGTAEWVSAIGEIVTACIGIVAGCIAWREYNEKRRRERLALAQRLIDRLSTDEMLRFAVTRLDWGTAILPVPSTWRGIIGEASIKLNVDELYDSLRPGLTDQTRNDPKRLLYRHAFVELFDFLERLDNLLDSEAIEVRDLEPIAWILEQLSDWPYAKPHKPEDFFLPALREWYPGGGPLRLFEAVKKPHAHTTNRTAKHEEHLDDSSGCPR
jgi:hypothetical protein